MSWPGTQIKGTESDVTETIGGVEYYVGTFDRATYIDDTHSCYFIINDGSNQSGNLEITGDRFIQTSDKSFIPGYYLLTTSGSDATLMAIGNTTYLNTTIGPFNSDTYYAIANSFAFTNNGTINWDADKSNILRPNTDLTVDFANASDVVFYRGQTNGSWKFVAGEAQYNFSFTLGSKYGEGDNKFTISPFFTRTISSLGYATFSSTDNVDVEGARATYITGVGANNVLTEVEFTDGIKANTGALLYKEGGGTVTFTPAASTPADVSSSNLLVAVSSDINELAQTDGSGNTNYILTNKTTNGESSIGFYKANSKEANTVSAGKAYLSLPTVYLGGAREFFILGEDIVTGIAAPKAVKNINGYYNLNGQRIAQPSKGLYIVNGKKVMVK